MTDACAFCEIVEGRAPATVEWDDTDYWVIRPLHPAVPGHLLFIPTWHVIDATDESGTTEMLFGAAARWLRRTGEEANLITSVGAAATQTVFHLHVHLVPRGPDDGLPNWWPWSRRELHEVRASIQRVEEFADGHLGSANANSIRRVIRGEPAFLPTNIGVWRPENA